MKVKQVIAPTIDMTMDEVMEKLRAAIHVCRGLEHARDITVDKADYFLNKAEEEDPANVRKFRGIGSNKFAVGKDQVTMKELQTEWFVFKGTEVAIKRVPKTADLIARLERYQRSLDRGQVVYGIALERFRHWKEKQQALDKQLRANK